MRHYPVFLAALSVLATACISQTSAQLPDEGELYVQHAVFPEGATLEQKVEIASRLVPSPRQLKWQRSELTAFLHFGINTFTNREWGNGRENPELFNPSELDARQWVSTLRECGFEMVILTAKHHDGFCLWPTATTSHSVASSPWRDGKGDVVAEVAAACAEYGMKFGVYLSPWDRNAECYGDSERYNEFFIAQLTELLTGYGEISEVWFDGACGEGPNGKKQEYDWDSYLAVIRRLQPDAVSAVMGEDVRWVGNEGGLGRETEWSATVITPGIYSRAAENNAFNDLTPQSKDLGSREKLEKAGEIFWYPSEVDVSIRPGWFWHERENAKVKSLKDLANIYFTSAGRNSVLLLNIPPDTRGLLNEADVNRLREFAEWRRATFSDNRIMNGTRTVALKAGESVEYRLKRGSRTDVVMLCEHIERGQRIEKFTVEALTADGWQEIAKGTTVGNKRLLRTAISEPKALRITIDECRGTAYIDCAGAYLSAPFSEPLPAEKSHLKPADHVYAEQTAPLTLDLGAIKTVAGFVYKPTSGIATKRTAVNYGLSASSDKSVWTAVSAGEFGNIMNNPIPQIVEFPEPVEARYIRIAGTSQSDQPAVISATEVEILIPADK